MINYSIRTAQSDDIPFIYSTWLNSYRYDSVIGKACRNSIFFAEYREVLDTILANKNTKVSIACLEEDPMIILGYMVYEPEVLHYTFVKEAFQKLGIAKQLFNKSFTEGEVAITHKTSSVEPILRKYPQLIFNPFKLYKKSCLESTTGAN